MTAMLMPVAREDVWRCVADHLHAVSELLSASEDTHLPHPVRSTVFDKIYIGDA